MFSDPFTDLHRHGHPPSDLGPGGGGFDGSVVQVVDSSDVRPVTNNTDTHMGLDPLDLPPRRHWRRWGRRRSAFWRANNFGFPMSPFGPTATGFGQSPFAAPNTEVANIPDIHQHSQFHDGSLQGQPMLNQPQIFGTNLLQSLGINNQQAGGHRPSVTPNNQQGPNPGSTNILSEAIKENLKDPSTINQLTNAVLQSVAGRLVTGIVDKLVDKVLPTNKPSVSLPGFGQSSQSAGRGFGLAQTHGTNMAVVPVIDHGDHVHLPHGDVVPVTNRNAPQMNTGWNSNIRIPRPSPFFPLG